MNYEFRVVVEKVSVASQKVVKRDTVKIYDINPPESILDLGLRHQEQISLLSKIQNALLAEQSPLIDTGYDNCPKCGQKLGKYGFKLSPLHAVFSDHKIRIQKHHCKNPECSWQSAPSTASVFGTDIHPDLAKLQCEQGALHSYRDAISNLEKMNAQRRSINNHDRVKIMTNKIGAYLAQGNLIPPNTEEIPNPAEELIVQVNSGNIPTKEKNRRSFEALSAIIYHPSSTEPIDINHHRVSQENCVMSAKDDKLQTMKTYIYHAALKQGLNEKTHVIGLADGAENCWSTISTLEPHCQILELILDWFHIGIRFQNAINALEGPLSNSLEKAKWSLWHGEVDKALGKIATIRADISDKENRSKLKKLQEYLTKNRKYLVNYQKRKNTGKTFTSQVAESDIDTIINTRYKQKQKMQWTREGAHNVLQIRALMASNQWKEKCLKLVMLTLNKAS